MDLLRKTLMTAGLIMAVFLLAVNASADEPVSATNMAQSPAPSTEAPLKTIMVFGDSLAAGYGLPESQSFPAQLEARLKHENRNVRVINAGVSGDTTAGGLRRLDYALKQKPDYVILELGANDMLRAVDPAVTRDNLRQMLEILKKYDRPVLLAGMRAFSNLGPVFDLAYKQMYADLAASYHTGFYPFFLEGVAGNPQLNQADGAHPTAAGVAVIVEKILPSVADLLVQQGPAPAGALHSQTKAQ